jgi:hypothetical protein
VSTILKQQIQVEASRAVSGSQRGKLVICTGAGKHSDCRINARGVESARSVEGRLASAIERLLNRSGIQYIKLQLGLLEVKLL